MGPVAQLVFKTSAVVQPTARSVRLRRRSVPQKVSSLQEVLGRRMACGPVRGRPLSSAQIRLVGQSTVGANVARRWYGRRLGPARGVERARPEAPQEDVLDARGGKGMAREGSIRNRSGDRYKPSVLRSYEIALRLRLLPELGGRRVS